MENKQTVYTFTYPCGCMYTLVNMNERTVLTKMCQGHFNPAIAEWKAAAEKETHTQTLSINITDTVKMGDRIG